MSRQLPKGWAMASLAELLTSLESGSRPRGGVRGISEGVPSIGGEHLNYNGGFNFDSVKYVPREFAAAMTKGHIRRNDILVVKDGATTGKTAFVGEDFPFTDAVVNEHVFVCRPVKEIEPRFLFRFLMSKEGQDRILDNFKGSAQGGINRSFAHNTEVPLAPLAEQRRIVAKLERLLGKVDACQQRLARIPVLLKRFRQSVLTAACSGRLTADWRAQRTTDHTDDTDTKPSAKSAKSVVKDWSSDDLPELPETWSWCRLGDYVENHDDKRIPVSAKEREKRKGEFPYYGASGVIDSIDGFTHEGEFVLIGEDGANLLSRSTPIAFVAKGRIWVNNHAHVSRCKQGFPNAFLCCYINSIDLAPYVTGTAQPKLNQANMNRIPVPVPPLAEQQEIVRRVEGLFALADRIEARFQKAKAQMDRLTQSLLAKAFRGELVPQDPNHEPAEKLLERIRAQRQSASRRGL